MRVIARIVIGQSRVICSDGGANVVCAVQNLLMYRRVELSELRIYVRTDARSIQYGLSFGA